MKYKYFTLWKKRQQKKKAQMIKASVTPFL